LTGKQRRDPTRTCVACREPAGKRGLLRVARGPEGAAAYDRSGRAPGRGAYLHGDPACIELGRRRRALERALRAQVPESLWSDLAAAATQPESAETL
jgi:predicted RNA-binding protein YlxR (DUF448 family)